MKSKYQLQPNLNICQQLTTIDGSNHGSGPTSTNGWMDELDMDRTKQIDRTDIQKFHILLFLVCSAQYTSSTQHRGTEDDDDDQQQQMLLPFFCRMFVLY